MFKRLSIFLSLLGAAVMSQAQLATGSWRQYPVFGEFSQIAESEATLYYVTGGSLYSYDKKADETRFFEGGSDISDYSIKDIYFNHDDNYLVVVYANGNMDIVRPDGSKTNLPDIKDSAANIDKTINDVAFHDGKIYVGTAFGLVVYDGTNHEVLQSGIYSRPVKSLDVIDGRILLMMGDAVDGRYQILAADPDARLNTLAPFTQLHSESEPFTRIRHIDDKGNYYSVIQWGTLRRLNLTPGTTPGVLNLSIAVNDIRKGKDGLYIISNTNPRKYYTLDADGMTKNETTLPVVLNNNVVSAYEGVTSIWGGDASGLGNYSVNGDNVTVLRDKGIPSDAISFSNICNIFPSNRPGNFYICNLGISKRHPLGSYINWNLRLDANRINSDNGTVEIINPTDVTATVSTTVTAQNRYGKNIFTPTFILEDVNDPDRLYIGTAGEGIYVVKNNRQIGKIDPATSKMSKFGGWGYASDARFDAAGNLWVGAVTDNKTGTLRTVQVLPADKVKTDPKTWTAADWIAPDFSQYIGGWEIKVLPCRGSNTVIAFDDEEGTLITYSHNGTLSNLADDSYMRWPNLRDQDGKEFSKVNMLCAVQDRNNQVWIGTSSGVITIPDPSRALNADFHINRVKVPRNDGSSYADYLLESDRVVSIAVDNSNRKWLATDGSGLFLVNESGTEILANYTKDNSPLPSNVITSVYCDPGSNSVFVGTFSGLYELASTSGPAREDYSDVFAYPNPVTPDYTGWITISGLMDSSMVKIVDSAMNTVAQVTSEGGTAIWDGCNMDGKRVRSGVYYVLASTSSATSSAGDVVTKILVIN